VQDVHLAIAFEGRVGGRLQLGFQRDVGLDAGDVGVGLLQPRDSVVERRLLDVAQHHLHAGLGEAGGHPKPDARRRAGDERSLARQVLHRPSPSTCPAGSWPAPRRVMRRFPHGEASHASQARARPEDAGMTRKPETGEEMAAIIGRASGGA
jgi:hypothetical protein